MPLLFSDKGKKIQGDAREMSNETGHFHVGVEHLMLALLREDDKTGSILSLFSVDRGRLKEMILETAGPGDKEEHRGEAVETPRFKRVMKNCEKVALSTKSFRIEPIHIFIAILEEGRGVPIIALRELDADPEMMRKKVISCFAGGEFACSMVPVEPVKKEDEKKAGVEKEKKLTELAKFSRDLIAIARDGKMDPVIGRNDEIRRVLQILTRKTKNNPVLIGEAGVGKTAVVFGLAQRISEGKVPDMLKDKRVLELSLSSMVAGAKHRGEFEERLQAVIREVSENPQIILFIDEIHTIVGAGDSRGGMDAGNILKPMLARGEFPCIGATTTDEYRKSLEQDPALERRFQPVLVNEPTEEDALAILNGLKDRYEKHHGVKFTEKAFISAVKLSERYLPDRNLPDKAIDLIDEAAAKVKTRSVSISDIEDLQFEVNEEVIAEVVSLWTGIPVKRLTSEEKERLLEMESYLSSRVIGQEDAVKTVSQTFRMVRMGLGSPNRPGGIFLFLGPTGVGKTELAKTLADFVFGSDKEMIRLDMSEFMEKHAVARLIGSPPGYVGHEEEGYLTKSVRTKPYSVVLLDEIEKAHPEIFDIFLQVFDDGRLTDSKGRTVSFTNTLIILTSNIGTSKVDDEGNTTLVNTASPEVREEIHRALRKSFRPEFLNRIDEIIIFNPLDRESLKVIVGLSLKEIEKRVAEKEIMLSYDDEVSELFLSKGYNPSYGARPLKRAISTYLSKPLAEKMLHLGDAFRGKIRVRVNNDEIEFCEDEPGKAEYTQVSSGGGESGGETIVGGRDED